MPPQFEPGMPVTITIDGKEYRVRFTLRALKDLQQDHGISVLSGNATGDAGKLAAILYYGLRASHPEITLDWVEDNVDTTMLAAMTPALAYAMSGKQPQETASPNPERPKVVNGVGLPFGPSDGSTSV
jgi:hypothetical protein